jgi:hypothetical protein
LKKVGESCLCGHKVAKIKKKLKKTKKPTQFLKLEGDQYGLSPVDKGKRGINE